MCRVWVFFKCRKNAGIVVIVQKSGRPLFSSNRPVSLISSPSGVWVYSGRRFASTSALEQHIIVFHHRHLSDRPCTRGALSFVDSLAIGTTTTWFYMPLLQTSPRLWTGVLAVHFLWASVVFISVTEQLFYPVFSPAEPSRWRQWKPPHNDRWSPQDFHKARFWVFSR